MTFFVESAFKFESSYYRIEIQVTLFCILKELVSLNRAIIELKLDAAKTKCGVSIVFESSYYRIEMLQV